MADQKTLSIIKPDAIKAGHEDKINDIIENSGLNILNSKKITLTGAIIVALGNFYAGLFSNSDKLSDNLIKSGKKTDEKVWRFPLGKEYDELLNCDIADMKNITGTGGAGSITAAQVLKGFIKKDVEWAHLDIAGVTWLNTDQPLSKKGGTAFGVRLLDNYIYNNYEK